MESVLGNLGLTYWTLAFCQISTASFTWGSADTQQVTRWQIYPISAWLSQVKWWAFRRLWVWHQHVLVCFGLELVEVLTRSRANVEIAVFYVTAISKNRKRFPAGGCNEYGQIQRLAAKTLLRGLFAILLDCSPNHPPLKHQFEISWKRTQKLIGFMEEVPITHWVFSANTHDWYFASQAPLASFCFSAALVGDHRENRENRETKRNHFPAA